ncbi:MAG: glycosyltransferase [Acidobacteria bacterium]|nr:glycosyltransferase [Acidobacteriota bacterium]
MADASPKLIILIPCLNEERTLPVTLAALPRSAPGVSRIETLVVNDGSTDATVDTARRLGVEHILDLNRRQGLARAFQAGLLEAARLGADYAVVLDADNQYNAADIPLLLEPLERGEADIVVGERPIDSIDSFSPVKKLLQRLGSWVVRRLSGAPVRDTPSGFRSYNRRAMLRLIIFDDYTYTQESLIAAREAGLRVVGVPIRINPEVLRESRLIKSLAGYVARSALTIFRSYLLYNTAGLLAALGAALGLAGLAGVGRFLYYFVVNGGAGHVQSLVLSAVLLTAAMLLFILAVVSEVLRANRRLLQMTLAELREQRYGRP